MEGELSNHIEPVPEVQNVTAHPLRPPSIPMTLLCSNAHELKRKRRAEVLTRARSAHLDAEDPPFSRSPPAVFCRPTAPDDNFADTGTGCTPLCFA